MKIYKYDGEWIVQSKKHGNIEKLSVLGFIRIVRDNIMY